MHKSVVSDPSKVKITVVTVVEHVFNVFTGLCDLESL
jgi:hypothetical protein